MLVHGWAIPATPNAQANLGRIGIFRMPCQIPVDEDFSPEQSNVLSEGISIKDMVTWSLMHGVPLIPTILIHDSGETDGWGYHGAHGRGRGPILEQQRIARYVRKLRRYLERRGANVHAWEFGNELGYAPTEGDKPEYYEKIVRLANAVADAALIPGQELILGCNKGGPGSLVEYVIQHRPAGSYVLDVHGNQRSISEVVDVIGSIREAGWNVTVLEDDNPGDDNDAVNRSRAFLSAGAIHSGFFGSRNVNFDGSNPEGRWGVSSNKRVRDSGAAWVFTGYLPEEFDRLVTVARETNTIRPGVFLPDDTDGQQPPVDPPNPREIPGEDFLILAMDRMVRGRENSARHALRGWWGEFRDWLNEQ